MCGRGVGVGQEVWAGGREQGGRGGGIKRGIKIRMGKEGGGGGIRGEGGSNG